MSTVGQELHGNDAVVANPDRIFFDENGYLGPFATFEDFRDHWKYSRTQFSARRLWRCGDACGCTMWCANAAWPLSGGIYRCQSGRKLQL